MTQIGRPAYLALGLLLLSSLLVSNALSQGSNMSTAINSTLSYVNKVNQSAYLVFYPNLTSAYNYINNAINVSHTDPAYAYALLHEAAGSAGQQLALVNRYRMQSFYVLVVVSAALAILLSRLMKPRPKARMKAA
jgi:hypothetical protein